MFWIPLMLLTWMRISVLMLIMCVLAFHDNESDIDDDTDDDTADDANDDTDDGGRGNRRPLPGGAEFISWMLIYDETLILDLVLSRKRLYFT